MNRSRVGCVCCSLTLLVFSIVILASQAQVIETPCTTPAPSAGICIAIQNCEPYVKVLVSEGPTPEVTAFLRLAACGWDRDQPLVCCPDYNQGRVAPSEPTVSVTVTQPTTPVPPAPTSKFLTAPACGRSTFPVSRVVNGSPAPLGAFPWIVALGYRNSKNPDQPRWLCGGTMISDRHILTAAHCLYNRPDFYLARLGDLDLYSEEDGAQPTTVTVSKAKLHENYSPATAQNDIAILTLSERNTNPTVKPICLPVNNPIRTKNLANRKLLVAGWGSVSFNGPSSPHLQMAQLPTWTNENCSMAYRNFSAITIDNRVLCAGLPEGGTDACQGDSGGPFMLSEVENGTFTFYQSGIISYGYRCALRGFPGVYTRVTSFLDWIEQNIE